MFNADNIIRALQSELPKALQAARSEGQGVVDRVKTDTESRNVALGAGAAGVLGGLLLSGVGGKFGRQVATLGGLAALGTLAYNAYQKHKGAAGAAGGAEQVFLPTHDAAKETVGKTAIRAMISAMKADGQIEAAERAKLFDHLGQAQLSDEEKAFLFDELARPLDVAALVAEATTPELALEIYAASLVAIDPAKPAEKVYLDDLAKRLNIDPAVAATLQAEATAA